MSGVLFNFIPGSGLIDPGIFAEVNSGGQYDSLSYGLVLGHKSAAGSVSPDAITLCSSVEEAAALAGKGSTLYEAFRHVRRKFPLATLFISAIPVSGTPGQWTITVGTLPAAGGDGVIEIAGRKVPLSVAAAEAAATTATNMAAAINAWTDAITQAYLPVTAAAASNVVTLTARHAGTLMNELEVYADPNLSGNIFGPTGRVTIAQSVPATGTASVATTLASLGDYPFDAVISPFSDTTNMDAAAAAFSEVSGRWAWYVQQYGHYWSVRSDTLSNNVTFGLGRNEATATVLHRTPAPTPSWEFGAAYAGRQLPWLFDNTNGNAARNQSDIPLEEIRPPRDRSLWPNQPGNNTLLGSGMSTWRVNSAGQVTIGKAVTLRRVNNQGMPDAVFRNVQVRYIVMHGLRYLRAGLSYRHANKAFALANPNNLPAISTPDDIRTDCIALYGDLVDRGLFQNKAWFAKNLVVVPDASNPGRCNIGFKGVTVNPLDILAINATIYNQTPSA